MTPYFSALTMINISSSVLLLLDFLSNKVVTEYQRKNLILAGVMIFLICISEFFANILNGASVKYRLLHILFNLIEFSLFPGIFFYLGASIYPRSLKWYNYFYFVWAAYITFMVVCIFLKTEHGIIVIDENNNYSRGKEIYLFMILIASESLFFFLINIYITMKIWKQCNIMLIIDYIFLFFTFLFRIMFPAIQVTMTCVIISIFAYYLYFEALFQEMDMETYLLDYISLKKWHKIHNKTSVVMVVIEIDNYSKLKLNYSRYEINNMIKEFSKLLLSYYSEYGRCYRVSSEEFAVIISDKNLDFDNINKNFFISIVKSNFELSDLPLASVGYSLLAPKTSLDQCFTQADEKKALFQQERLKYLF